MNAQHLLFPYENEPVIKVIIKLMTKGTNAESRPSMTETIIDRNMKNALTSSAFPTFNDIGLTLISHDLPSKP